MTEPATASRPHQYFDLVIAGGGFLGATLAILLAKSLPQRRLLLIDQQAFNVTHQPLLDARSTALAPTSVKLLRDLGLWGDLESKATPIQKVLVTDAGHIGRVQLTQQLNHQQPLGYIVENQQLMMQLRQQLPHQDNLCVWTPETVQQAEWRQAGVRVQLNTGSVETQLLVLADGADSSLKDKFGIHSQVYDYQQHALVCNIRHQLPHQGTAFERFTSQGPLAVLPLDGTGGQVSALVWTHPTAAIAAALAWSDAEFLQRLQAVLGYRLGRLLAVGQRQSFPLSLRLASEQIRSGLVVMGNAAHFLHPVAGQGYNLALRDAARLAEVLVKAGDDSLGDLATLSRYLSQQWPDQVTTVGLSHAFNLIFRRRDKASIAMRNLAMGGVEYWPGLRELLVTGLSGRAFPAANP